MNDILVPERIITGEQFYSSAISLILQNAKRKLLVFDQDFSRGGFDSLEKFHLFQNFLSANITSELTIILQNSGYFQDKCPRLLNLLGVYGHKMHVYVTNETIKHAKDCFILADDKHYIKRIHIDQARFRYAFDDRAGVEALNSRFIELMEASAHTAYLKPPGL